MSEQILFYKKNKGDLSYSSVIATASQGNDYAEFAINRNPRSAWVTSGSVDADNTTFTLDFGVLQDIDTVLLVNHNLKAFTVKYWDGAAYQAFTPAISETTNTKATNKYSVTSQSTTKIQLRITGTQTANADKYLYHFIATELIGQFDGWPVIANPILGKNKNRNTVLSGKSDISENLGYFRCELSVKALTSDADLTIIESLFDSNEGFLVWPCGGDEAQFKTIRQGYRLEDIYLMKPVNDFSPEYVNGLYGSGIKVNMKLEEVIA